PGRWTCGLPCHHVTLPRLELAAPAATTWSLPLTLYPVVPPKVNKDTADQALNQVTQQVVTDLMSVPGKARRWSWCGSTSTSPTPSLGKVTLRQLLKLDKLKDVPDWPSGNYDYFWIVNFAQGFGILPASTWMKQVFSGRFADLPSNEWGE